MHGLPMNMMEALAQDGNAGLLKQALAARQMRHTQRLTQTYLTLSLADIARHVGLASPQEAEQHILRQAPCLYAVLVYMPCLVSEWPIGSFVRLMYMHSQMAT